MNIVGILIFGILGYLLGAIPFAAIIARSKGVDIFSFGSGNPGATNVKRACGKFAGNLCFFLDALKGFLAAILTVWASMFGKCRNKTDIRYRRTDRDYHRCKGVQGRQICYRSSLHTSGKAARRHKEAHFHYPADPSGRLCNLAFEKRR